MVSRQNHHITEVAGASPLNHDIAITLYDPENPFSDTIDYLINELSLNKSVLSSINAAKDFYFLKRKTKPSVLFIMVSANSKDIVEQIQRNLFNAIEHHEREFYDLSFWVPLFGYDIESIGLQWSTEFTRQILEKLDSFQFTIATPVTNNTNFIDYARYENNGTSTKSGPGSKVETKDSKKSKPTSDSDSTPNNTESRKLELEQYVPNAVSLKIGIDSSISDNNIFVFKSSKKNSENYDTLLKDVFQIGERDLTAETSGEFYDIKSYQFEDRQRYFIKADYDGFINNGEIESWTSFIANLNQSLEDQEQLHFFIDLIPIEDASKYKKEWIESFCTYFKDLTTSQDVAIRFVYTTPHATWDINNYVSLAKTIIEDAFEETSYIDKIPFQLDRVVDVDKLGREPVARAFVRLIKQDIFTEGLVDAFMVHLQGRWGSGKSSFLNFIKKNLNADNDEWIVVEYNAWQNQHIDPPWWSFVDQLYLQSKEQVHNSHKFKLRLKEFHRRVWSHIAWQRILAVFFLLVFLLCVIYYGKDILLYFQTLFGDETKKSNDAPNHFKTIVEIVITLGSLFTFFYGLSKSLSSPFVVQSSQDAETFVSKARDPMNRIKKHFNALVDDITKKGSKRQLAIFIDDIDRCDQEFIVRLLEGIQTLFKDRRVLYIVAGDKNWISTSFANVYEKFSADEDKKKQLGEFFIEKAFQLSIRLPNVTDSYKRKFWNHILGFDADKNTKRVESFSKLPKEQQSEIKTVLQQSKSKLTNPDFVQNFEKKYNLSSDEASNIVIEEKNKDTEAIKHLLQDYHTYIDTNPRSIIRLANNYTMTRSILMAERASFSEHVLFRWLIIEDLCPKVKSIVRVINDLQEVEDLILAEKDVVKKEHALALLKGEDDIMEGELTIEAIKIIKGI